MNIHINKRLVIEQEEVDLQHLDKTMKSLFPKRNDCASMNQLEDAFLELKQFGINTKKQLRLFLKKYRRWLLIIDKEPLDLMHQRIYREDLGDEEFLDAMRKQYWFCYPALIRNAMEREFGEKYEKFARKRDEI